MASILQTAARALTSTDDTYSDYEKAVNLFKLQAWIFSPTPEIRRAARHLVTVKMLEHLQAHICPENPRFKALAANRDYRKMFDDFLDAGGWKELRHTTAVKVFDKEHQNNVIKSNVVSNIVDFSIRYDPPTQSGRSKGRSTMARSIILSSAYYNIGMGRTKLLESWTAYKHSAPFIYLFNMQGFMEIKPYRVSKIKFAERLIKAATRSNNWQNLFLNYNAVVETLNSRGYSYEMVRCGLGDGQADLKFDPLPPEVLQHIRNYSSRG